MCISTHPLLLMFASLKSAQVNFFNLAEVCKFNRCSSDSLDTMPIGVSTYFLPVFLYLLVYELSLFIVGLCLLLYLYREFLPIFYQKQDWFLI